MTELQHNRNFLKFSKKNSFGFCFYLSPQKMPILADFFMPFYFLGRPDPLHCLHFPVALQAGQSNFPLTLPVPLQLPHFPEPCGAHHPHLLLSGINSSLKLSLTFKITRYPRWFASEQIHFMTICVFLSPK